MSGTLINSKNLASGGVVLALLVVGFATQTAPIFDLAATVSSANEIAFARQNDRQANGTAQSGSAADAIVLARQNHWQVNGTAESGSAADAIVRARQGGWHVSSV